MENLHTEKNPSAAERQTGFKEEKTVLNDKPLALLVITQAAI